jgi:hypothetical protein
MINVNQRIGQPFGDIYTPNTSHTDRLSQQLYAEEKQREAKEAAMQEALDNEFSKNLTGIRDIDTDDLTKAYGDFKIANKAAMRQRDGVSPKQQMELLKKKAAMYDIINKSKTQKGLEDDVLKGLAGKDRDNYEDNSYEILKQSRATPLSKLGNLYGYDYSYKGTNTDFQKIDNLAIGQPKQVYAKEDLVDESGIQTKITPYMFGNTPSQYYEGMLGALAQHGVARDAAILIGKVPNELLSKTQDEYLKIPIEKWEKMGVGKKQDLTITPNDSKAQIFAKHKAQLYALNNEPKEGVPTYRTNEAKKIDKEFTNRKILDAINFRQQQELKAIDLRNSKELDRSRAESKSKGDYADNLWVDNYLDIVDAGAEPIAKGWTNLFGKDTYGDVKKISPTNALYEYLGKPQSIKLKDGKYIIEYERLQVDNEGKPTGAYEIDPTRSGTFTRDDIKLSMGVKAVGKKNLPNEMNYNKGAKSKPTNNKTVSLNANDWK